MTNTILVVEDDPAVLRLIGQALERAGYNCALARTAEDALTRLLWLHEPALIIADHELHGSMPGSDFLRRVHEVIAKKVGHHTAPPVIGLCGGTRRCQASMRRAGAAEVLHKPFNREQLLEAVGRHLPPPTTIGV